jgi:hypothetical protein
MTQFQNKKPSSEKPQHLLGSEGSLSFDAWDGRERVDPMIKDLRNKVLAHFEALGKSEAAPNYLTLRFAPLLEQYKALQQGHPMRKVLSDCLISISELQQAFNSTPQIELVLLKKLYDSNADEVTKFLIRELVVTFKVGQSNDGMHATLQDACTFAKHMISLKKNLTVEEGPTIQADLARITKSPDAWRSLLSHIVEGVVRGSNQYHLIPRLLANVPEGCSLPNIHFLQDLAGDPHNSNENKQIAMFLLGEVPTWQVLIEEPPLSEADEPDFPSF